MTHLCFNLTWRRSYHWWKRSLYQIQESIICTSVCRFQDHQLHQEGSLNQNNKTQPAANCKFLENEHWRGQETVVIGGDPHNRPPRHHIVVIQSSWLWRLCSAVKYKPAIFKLIEERRNCFIFPSWSTSCLFKKGSGMVWSALLVEKWQKAYMGPIWQCCFCYYFIFIEYTQGTAVFRHALLFNYAACLRCVSLAKPTYGFKRIKPKLRQRRLFLSR